MYGITRLLMLVLLAATPILPQGAPVDTRVVCEFDGSPDESWQGKGLWRIERDPKFVRSGTGSLRFTMGPPARWPGPRIRRPALVQKGFRFLKCEVFNTTDAPVTLHIRIDDEASRGKEPEILRRRQKLKPGWNHVSLDLAELESMAGRRMLDPEQLTLLILYTNLPKREFDLIFDHLRFERPRIAGDEKERVRRTLKRFKDGYREGAGFDRRRDLIRQTSVADTPERTTLLTRRVLRKERDCRLILEALRVLGRTREESNVAAAIKEAQRARQEERWRLYAALGRMPSARAREFLVRAARQDASSADKTAAIRALVRAGDTGMIPLLTAELPGSWQLRATRIRALRTIDGGDAFPKLVGYLTDGHARNRLEAHEALVAMSGRDLGDSVENWLAWWRAAGNRRGKPGAGHRIERASYARYYGIPLVPGRIAFCIDVSGSMTAELGEAAAEYVSRTPHLDEERIRTRIDLAKAELIRAIEMLDERSSFNVIWYGTFVYSWNRRGYRKATPDAKKDAQGRVRGLDIAGYTNIHGALVKAFRPSERASFARTYDESVDTIFLLSDGHPTAGEISNGRHLVADICERDRVRVIRINTIGMGVKNSYVLRELARRTGGIYKDLSR